MRTAQPLPVLVAAALVLVAPSAPAQDLVVRVAAYNAEDIRTSDIASEHQPRLDRIAETIQRLRPNILLLSEIAYDQAGGFRHAEDSAAGEIPDGVAPGQNAARFVDRFLSRPQARGLEPIEYQTWMPPVNTGEPSGFDLDRSGSTARTWPSPSPANPDGSPAAQTPEQREFGNDAWGFGTFPGQYGMALLVDPRFEILHDHIRTYRLFRWKDLPGSAQPTAPDGTPWYDQAAWDAFRLSSKTLASVPIRLPNDQIVYCVISHPTPPAFDGPESRNKLRNRDEIRLLRAYLDNEPWLTDDHGDPGGLPPGAIAIVLGDLNADPTGGSSIGDPIAHLLASPALGPDPAPVSEIEVERLDPSDTARFGLRVDYVLPGRALGVVRTGIWREPADQHRAAPSDHFTVWAEFVVPSTNTPAGT